MNKLPITINNLQFAKQKQVLSGVIDAMAFERLHDVLVVGDAASGTENQVRYILSGWLDVQHRVFLKLAIEADLRMNCQRCLSVMPVNLSLNFTYQITHQTEQELIENEPMEDDVDLIEADTNMDVGLLMEDELMMALPIAAVHADVCMALKMSSGEKVTPFAALQKLKK